MIFQKKKTRSAHFRAKTLTFSVPPFFRESDMSQTLMRTIVLCKMRIKCWFWYSFGSYPLSCCGCQGVKYMAVHGAEYGTAGVALICPFYFRVISSLILLFYLFFLQLFIHFTQFGQRSSQEKAVFHYMLVKAGPQTTCCLYELSK